MHCSLYKFLSVTVLTAKTALLSTGVIFLCTFSASAQQQKVTINRSEQRAIHSAINGNDYLLNIYLPEGYGKTDKKYPVLYVPDAQWGFPMLTGLYDGLYMDGFIPEMIIVGITWAGENLNYDSLRERDFTPSKNADFPNSGNATKFLEVITKEMIPVIESGYKARNDDRTLMGMSFAGIFTIYTLFKETSLFRRYILASPVLQWDDDFLFKYEKAYSDKTAALNTRIFIGSGALDQGAADIRRFTEQLKSRKYRGLNLTTTVFENMGLGSSIPEAFNQGLKSAFAKTPVTLDTVLLNHYVGTYQRAKDDEFKLFRRGRELVMQYSDKITFVLSAENQKDFYVNGIFLNFQFKKNAKGEVEGVAVKYSSGEGYYLRVGR